MGDQWSMSSHSGRVPASPPPAKSRRSVGPGSAARAALRLTQVIAVLVTPWLALTAASAGGWTRFGVGCVVASVGYLVLRRELPR